MLDLASSPGGGLIVVPDNFITSRTELLVSLTAQYNLPAIHPYKYFSAAGGLVSYGIDPADTFTKAPSYVDSILRGTKPQDLPVQFPTRFELVINLKTVKTLGLTVPPNLLAQADKLID